MEKFVGGVGAIANNLSNFAKKMNHDIPAEVTMIKNLLKVI